MLDSARSSVLVLPRETRDRALPVTEERDLSLWPGRGPRLLDARPWVSRLDAERLPELTGRSGACRCVVAAMVQFPLFGKEIQDLMWLPYPAWLSPGNNAWQMTAATLVGLMSVPGLVVLYGGVMQKRWSINSMMLTFAAFAVVLDRVGAVGLQDGLRHAVSRHLGLGFLRQLHRQAGHRS